MTSHRNNSVIFRDVDEDDVINFTHLGTLEEKELDVIELEEESHGFIIGDAIYYDIKTKHYRRALAINNIMSEVIGVVSNIIDKDNFELTLKGIVKTNRYDNYNNNDYMYLSDIVTGKLINLEPRNISKIIAIKTENGIDVKIQRGYNINGTDEKIFTDARYYTEQEINDIINTVIAEIY